MQHTPENETKEQKIGTIVTRFLYNLEHLTDADKWLLVKTLVEKLDDAHIDSLAFAVHMTPIPEQIG